MKKAVFFDIDGTLIDAAHGKPFMSPAVREAMRELQRQGHLIFIATGRPYAFLNEEIRSFGFDGFVLMNGAAVLLGNQLIYSKAMRPEVGGPRRPPPRRAQTFRRNVRPSRLIRVR